MTIHLIKRRCLFLTCQWCWGIVGRHQRLSKSIADLEPVIGGTEIGPSSSLWLPIHQLNVSKRILLHDSAHQAAAYQCVDGGSLGLSLRCVEQYLSSRQSSHSVGHGSVPLILKTITCGVSSKQYSMNWHTSVSFINVYIHCLSMDLWGWEIEI